MISIIITSFNYGKFIKNCIESALCQNCTEKTELIIVDDGSKDNSLNIINSYTNLSNVKVINTKRYGLAKASNYGIKHASGDKIIRLDADDMFYPNALKVLLNNMLEKNSDFVTSDLSLIDVDGNEVGKTTQSDSHVKNGMIHYPAGSGVLYKKEIWSRLGGYDETLNYQEDFDFWLRVKEKFIISYVNEKLYKYRKHFNTMSTNLIPKFKFRAFVKGKAVLRNKLLKNITFYNLFLNVGFEQKKIFYEMLYDSIKTLIRVLLINNIRLKIFIKKENDFLKKISTEFDFVIYENFVNFDWTLQSIDFQNRIFKDSFNVYLNLSDLQLYHYRYMELLNTSLLSCNNTIIPIVKSELINYKKFKTKETLALRNLKMIYRDYTLIHSLLAWYGNNTPNDYEFIELLPGEMIL